MKGCAGCAHPGSSAFYLYRVRFSLFVTHLLGVKCFAVLFAVYSASEIIVNTSSEG